MAAVTASTRHGVKAKRITPNDILRIATGSKLRPARARITDSAALLHMKISTKHQYCTTYVAVQLQATTITDQYKQGS